MVLEKLLDQIWDMLRSELVRLYPCFYMQNVTNLKIDIAFFLFFFRKDIVSYTFCERKGGINRILFIIRALFYLFCIENVAYFVG